MKKVYITAKGDITLKDGLIRVNYTENTSDRIECRFPFGAAKDNYVLFPSAVYNGNMFKVKKADYVPAFASEKGGTGKDMPVTISDVPRLQEDGSGEIELTTGDVSVPCIAVFKRRQKKACFLWTVQQAAGENLGLAYSDGTAILSCPARRSKIYSMCRLSDKELRSRTFLMGESVEIPYKLMVTDCADLGEFFSLFYKHRSCMGLPVNKPFSMKREDVEKKLLAVFNDLKWCEKLGIYTVGTDYEDNRYSCWQAGWVGGCIAAYAMLLRGGEQEKNRALRAFDFMLSTQTKAGLFYHGVAVDGSYFGSAGETGKLKTRLLTRVAGDILYFTVSAIELLDKRGDNCTKYDVSMRRFADALCRIYAQCGEFGYSLDCESADIAVYGSTSGAIIPAGLVKAYKRYKDSLYLKTAEESGRMMFERDALAGYTTGGPGDSLQNADSESSYALLESMVSLYELTGRSEWLERAEYAANLLSTWIVAYDYVFPASSTFGKMDIKTTGTVFANIQNKHSAPGFCTYSGSALTRLAAHIGDESYALLAKQVAGAMPQCMSAENRPIPARLYGDGTPLPDGMLNERVNMSDWEGDKGVGEIFPGSCWSELSLLLSDGV